MQGSGSCCWEGSFSGFLVGDIKVDSSGWTQPGRALKLIFEWLELHREELMENWKRAQIGSALVKIEPLK